MYVLCMYVLCVCVCMFACKYICVIYIYNIIYIHTYTYIHTINVTKKFRRVDRTSKMILHTLTSTLAHSNWCGSFPKNKMVRQLHTV